jgi:hypothetical protein
VDRPPVRGQPRRHQRLADELAAIHVGAADFARLAGVTIDAGGAHAEPVGQVGDFTRRDGVVYLHGCV